MDSSLIVKKPDTAVADRQISEALTYAQALTISSQEDYLRADALCKKCLTLRKIIDADFAESEEAAETAYQAAKASRKANADQKEGHKAPLMQVEKILKPKMFAFREAEESRRRIEQDKANAEARRRAEDEALRKAAALEASGQGVKAEAVLNKPVRVVPVVVPNATPKSETVIRQIWKFEILDADAIPREYLKVDEVKIGQVVRALKGGAEAAIPGIRAWSEAV